MHKMNSSTGFSVIRAVGLVFLLAWTQEVTSLMIRNSVTNVKCPESLKGKKKLCGLAYKPYEGFRGQRLQNTMLQLSALPPLTKAVGTASPSVRNAVFLGAAVLAILKRQQILYPGTSPDPKYSEPLPPGTLGCPFFGHNILKNTNERGPGEFFRRTSAMLGNARIFKYMFIGNPVVAIAGI
jgi:hypothetical protein